MLDLATLALFYFEFRQSSGLEEPAQDYLYKLEDLETKELLSFVRMAIQEIERRNLNLSPQIKSVRITRTLKVFIGGNELRIRPMAKTVLLLFLRHPEGIALKSIADYKDELLYFYRRLSKSSDPKDIQERILKIMDFFNNDLNVNIARVNSAVASLVGNLDGPRYMIEGRSGERKSITLDRSLVHWE